MSGATTPKPPEGVPQAAAVAAADAGEERQRLSLTASTARPEGGGRAVGGGHSAPVRQWPILAVIGLTAMGLILVASDAFRVGTVLVGAALLGGAVLRVVLPSVGMLAVRSRFTDVITYSVLGTTILLLALMAQPQPILEIPFLQDVIRFTVR